MSEQGSAALELALGIGGLVIPAVIAVLSFAPWLEARAFVRSASAEAARAAVLAAEDPASVAAEVVAGMASARGYSADAIDLSLCGGEECRLERGGVVTVRVAIEIPLVSTPWGGVGGLAVAGFHAEPVDAYRSLP